MGVQDYSDAIYDSDYVLFWDEVFSSSERPRSRLWLEGKCLLNRASRTGVASPYLSSETAPATTSAPIVQSIRFDGKSCYGIARNHNLNDWDGAASGAFTAVWIGRFSPQAARRGQTYMTLSRTQSDYDQEIYWTTDQAFLYSHAAGFAVDFTVAPPPAGQWTMEVLARSSRYDSATVSYYRYGQADSGLHAWQFKGSASALGPDNLVVGADFRDDNKYFEGDVAAVLMYNRALSEREVLALASFYSPRFGWAPPPSPASS